MGGLEFIDEIQEVKPTDLEIFAEELAEKEGIKFQSSLNKKHESSRLCCFSRYGSKAIVKLEYYFLCTHNDEFPMKPDEVKKEKQVKKDFSEEVILTELTGRGTKKIILFRYAPKINDTKLYEVRLNNQKVGFYAIEELIETYHKLKKI